MFLFLHHYLLAALTHLGPEADEMSERKQRADSLSEQNQKKMNQRGKMTKTENTQRCGCSLPTMLYYHYVRLRRSRARRFSFSTAAAKI